MIHEARNTEFYSWIHHKKAVIEAVRQAVLHRKEKDLENVCNTEGGSPDEV